jgi:hypothetical protein
MNPDWNFEPDDDECEECEEVTCICEDPYEPDTLKDYLGEE